MRDVKMGLTIDEAAEMTGIGRNTMRKLVDWGKLPVLKVGRKTIIRRDTLENFMTVNQGRNLLNQADVREVRYRMDTAGKRPRRLRAKYTPRTNLAICTRGISLLRRACVSAPAWMDRDATGNRPALSGVVPPRRRDNIRGTEDGRRRTKERR